MSTDTQTLIHQSLQGNRDAFGQIVQQHQAAVSAVTYSITGNLTQSEDLAQEAFIIAWRKLGSLENPAALAPWLCGIARNLARDWVRRQAKRRTVPLDESGQLPDPNSEVPEARRQREEQSDLVWSALAQLPEQYREPLIHFYRQGESIRAIAEALELTEDNVKQRLSRGRKMLRAEVETLVETTLTDTRPGKKFTAGVLAALPVLYGAKAGAAEVAASGAKIAAAPVAMGVAAKLGLSAAALALVVLPGLWWGGDSLRSLLGASADLATAPESAAPGDGASRNEPEATTQSSATTGSTMNATSANPTASEFTTAVTGIVVTRGSGEPAPGMRVVYGRQDIGLTETLSDDNGRFTFEGVPAGKYVTLAYDARYDEMPEDDFRSDHYLVTVTPNEAPPEIRIEVPASGLALTGRITDANTEKPLAGVKVMAIGEEVGGREGKSDSAGQYQILGLNAGLWRVYIHRNNPIFTSDFIKDMDTVVVEAGKPPVLDFAVDRGIAIHGVAVDTAGQPVPEASIGAELYPTGGLKHDCYFKADADGTFTVWGARSGDKAVLQASKDELGSFIEVIQVTTDGTPERITLTLRPKTAVSGRFVDEAGRPVEAQLWSRPRHPDVPRGWKGTSERAETFSTALVPGPYEIKGLAKGVVASTFEESQPLEVGATPIEGLIINVTTKDPNAGNFTLSGRVVNEQGEPLRKCRIYMDGDSRDTLHAPFQETRTDDQGHFQFDGLMDGSYRVHATPENPYEEFAGYEKLNPAETPEVIIVARRAPILRGRVLDAKTGKPIPKFEVDCGEVYSGDRESRWGPMSPSIHSETGEFSFPARLDKEWFLRVSARGYARQRVTGAPLSSGEEPEVMTFKLMPSRVVQGTVVDSDGNPVPRAFVFADSRFINGTTKSPDTAIAESDSDGHFTVDSIPAETQNIYIWKEDYAAVMLPIAGEIHAVLHTGGVIEGRVTVNGAIPAGEFSVYASAPESADSNGARTNPEGTYRLSNLMDTTYRIQVTIRGEDGLPSRYFAPEVLVEAHHSTPVTHDIDVPIGNAAIEGTLLQAGAPVAEVEIQCKNGETRLYTTTSELGAYRFEGLTAGIVEISIHIPHESPIEGNPYHNVLETEINESETLQQDLEWPG